MNVAAITDASVDSAIRGGTELIALGRTVLTTTPDRGPLDAVADVIGLPAAIDAAAVAANFQIMNRVVDATGLPIGKRRRDGNAELIAALGLDGFPHAEH